MIRLREPDWLPVTLAAGMIIPFLMAHLDLPIAQWAANQSEGFKDIFRLITIAGESHYVLVPAGVIGLWAAWAKRKELAHACGFIFAAVAIGGILTNIVKAIVGRARPKHFFNDGVYTFDPVIFDGSWHSFPSGHTNSAMGAVIALAMLFPKWRLLLLGAGFTIAFSRVAINAHYMADILGGALLAWFTCWWVGSWMAKRDALFEIKTFEGRKALIRRSNVS